jgi:hypothetical protein
LTKLFRESDVYSWWYLGDYILNAFMRLLSVFLLFVIILSCNPSGGADVPRIKTSNGSEIKYSYLRSGTYQVEYYASKEPGVADRALLQRVSVLIRNNKQTAAYFREMAEQPVPAYRSDVGLTKAEYDRMVAIFSYKEPERLNGKLEIVRSNNRFRFNGEGRLSLLNELSVDEELGTASFRQVEMISVNDSLDLFWERIPDGDTIVSYRFYRGPAGLLALSGLEGEYELLVCKLAPGKRTYLSFYARSLGDIEHPVPEFITVVFDAGVDLKKWIED